MPAFTGIRRTAAVLSIGLALMAAVPQTAAAIGLAPQAKNALQGFRLNDAMLNGILATVRQAKAQGIRTDAALNISADNVSISDLSNRIDAQPALKAMLSHHGLTARDFVLGALAMMQGALVSQGGQQAAMAEGLLGKPEEANLGFYRSHQQTANTLLTEISTSGQAAQGAGDSKQMQECATMTAGVTPALLDFQSAMKDSQAKGQVAGGTFAQIAQKLNDTAAKVSTPEPREDLRRMAAEIRKQEGRRKVEVSPEFKSATQGFEGWVRAHCTGAAGN